VIVTAVAALLLAQRVRQIARASAGLRLHDNPGRAVENGAAFPVYRLIHVSDPGQRHIRSPL
jgi:hypothetical protein